MNKIPKKLDLSQQELVVRLRKLANTYFGEK
jgi:hypothetical protein